MKEEKNEARKIIKSAPERMREMLRSAYLYNSNFSSFSEKEKLLEKILFSMTIIDRKFFAQDEAQAYDDNALPIGKGQTISQPSTVARMLLLAELEEEDEVLEIGTGSGWNASLIAFLVHPGSVLSIDRVSSLVEGAQENMGRLRNYLKQKHPQDFVKIEKLNFLTENIFSKGKIWKKRYDKIIITAGIEDKEAENKIEEIAKSLLRKKGLLICPHVSGPLIIFKKKDNLIKEETKEHYVFVPLLKGVEK